MARAARQPPAIWHRRLGAALFGSYTTRVLLSLAVTLLLVGLCFHLPFESAYDAIGWQISSETYRPMIDLVDVRTQQPEKATAGAPITQFGATEEEDVAEGQDEVTSDAEDLPAPVPPVTKMKVRQTVLEFAEQQPSIVGGLGAYYIHIEYPEEAIRQGIEGRLMLTFVVETNGEASEIEVLRSLHPVCDSAAVQALRRTRFVPGKQNDEAVRVRMRLPVRFKLVDPTSRPDSSDAPPTASNQG